MFLKEGGFAHISGHSMRLLGEEGVERGRGWEGQKNLDETRGKFGRKFFGGHIRGNFSLFRQNAFNFKWRKYCEILYFGVAVKVGNFCRK